ncbi:MAG: hypothetical protein A2V70_09080 [Planctomycetes bacterium RBG_13_63_9]|nr:MAG: hypothetical protein A2V70_09080 [Planctomycetes bacterium RBG_13_63_9]
MQIAVVGAFAALWLIIPAYEIVLVLFVQSVMVIVALPALPLFAGRTSTCNAEPRSELPAAKTARFQYGLWDLLLFTVVVSLVLAVAVSAPTEVWVSWENMAGAVWATDVSLPGSLPAPWVVYLFLGAVGGLVTLVAAWVALSQRPVWLRLILLLLVSPSAILAGWLLLLRASGWLAAARPPDTRVMKQGHRGQRMRLLLRRLARVAIVVVSLLIVIPLGVVFLRLATPIRVPEATLLDPNGYDDLVRAAAMLNGVGEPDPATAETLRTYVTTHRDVLELARRGLRRECCVPIEYSLESISHIQSLRTLVRGFLAEGQLAEKEGRVADAAESYLDATRLGHATARGGLLIDALAGWAIDGIGRQELYELRGSLGADACRQIVGRMEAAARDWEPFENVIAREKLWSERVFGWQGRLDWLVRDFLPSSYPALQMCAEAEKRSRAERRLLICEFALRVCDLERGQLPEELGGLVPEYLSHVPEDPFSGDSLIYRRQPKGYVLYSIGPDGIDDGGRPLDSNTGLGDVVLEEGR